MLDKIFITTYNRPNKQITWNNLPSKWKEKTVLVVQEKEKDLYPEYPILVLPSNVTNLPTTREWIVKNNRDRRIGIMDDDLSFFKTRMKDDNYEKSKVPMDENDFLDFEKQICSWMDEGIPLCGMDVAWNIPDRDNEYKEITRSSANFFFDLKIYPIDDIGWTEVLFAEDFHTNLQLFKLGKKNRVSNRYRIDPGPTQQDGGCASQRDIDSHNESMFALAKAHPGIVELYEKQVESGPWKGQPKMAAKIAWKKAYKQSEKENSLSSFFD